MSQRMGGSALFEVDARSGANCIVVGTFDLGNPRPCSQYPSFLVGTSWWTDACESMWPHGHRRMLRTVPCYRFSTQAAASTVHDRIVCVCISFPCCLCLLVFVSVSASASLSLSLALIFLVRSLGRPFARSIIGVLGPSLSRYPRVSRRHSFVQVQNKPC